MRYLVSLCFMFCAAPIAYPSDQASGLDQTTKDASNLFLGVWQNDRGSIVRFTSTKNILSGYYRTQLGQPDKSQKFPLTGFVQGDIITFTVNFTGYGSMTSWTGQLTDDEKGDYIRTLWHLTRDVEDDQEETDLWRSITTGASKFRRLSTPP
jgi:hypothetical protein